MPLLPVARFLAALMSWAVLGGALYLLWTWFQGVDVVDDDGLHTVRETWRAGLGLALLGWSVLGRYPTLLLLGRRDVDPSAAVRADGERIKGAAGSDLYVETHGEGPTLLLTHGWGLDSTVWGYARRRLSGRFRVVVWDLPGLGRSRLARNRVDLRDMADELRGLLLAAPGPVVLVGHSIGGMILQTLARDHPAVVNQRVSGMVLLNTTYTNPLRTMILSRLATAARPLLTLGARFTIALEPLAWLGAWQGYFSGSAHAANRLGFGRHVTRSQLDHVSLLTARNRPGVQARGNLAMFDWDSGDALSRVTCPVLIISDDSDIITRPEAGARLAALAPAARLAVVEGGNHLGFLALAERYNTLIAEFAEAVTAAEPDPYVAPT